MCDSIVGRNALVWMAPAAVKFRYGIPDRTQVPPGLGQVSSTPFLSP